MSNPSRVVTIDPLSVVDPHGYGGRSSCNRLYTILVNFINEGTVSAANADQTGKIRAKFLSDAKRSSDGIGST